MHVVFVGPSGVSADGPLETGGKHPFRSLFRQLDTDMEATPSKNVLGGELQSCSTDPKTGFYRDGCCHTGPRDLGSHVICAEMNEAFLEFTMEQGNDLMTPRPEMNFPGLAPGDRWCLCVGRWKEAVQSGVAPPVILEATHEAALDILSLDVLKAHAIDTSSSSGDSTESGGDV